MYTMYIRIRLTRYALNVAVRFYYLVAVRSAGIQTPQIVRIFVYTLFIYGLEYGTYCRRFVVYTFLFGLAECWACGWFQPHIVI